MTDNNGSQDSLMIERTLGAPVNLVWKMWTDPEHFKAWYGPMGARIPVAEIDAVVGGRRFVCMEMDMPDRTMQMYFAGEHRDVVVDQRLSYSESMADENGNVKSPAEMGMPDGHPESTEVIVELSDVEGGTSMKMTHVGVPAGSPGEGGWNMALDKLVAHLETVQA